MTEIRLQKNEDCAAAINAVRYEILTSRLSQDGVDYLTYGIRCMGDQGGHWLQLDAVPDMFFQRERAAELAELFNRRQLSQIHFREAVLDCVNA